MRKKIIKRPRSLALKVLFLLLKIPLLILASGLNAKPENEENETMTLFKQNPSLFDPRPLKDIPPNER